ncbi:MAG TPA: hypothetical protein PKD64_12830 [Pirellulaceae bacterium]|nr:hypothetical protein [Pirellulaceae bacterium]HMP69977.1 hypothetical protein [Pirellulaceae bacterium]
MPSSHGTLNCPFCGELSEASPMGIGDKDRAQANTTPRLRTDAAHSPYPLKKGDVTVTSEIQSERSVSRMHHEDPLAALASQSWINLAGFFVVVFLVGQSFTLWAFLAGHFGAWCLGQTFFIVGITTTFWLLIRQVATLADQNRIMANGLKRIQRETTNAFPIKKGKSHAKTHLSG